MRELAPKATEGVFLCEASGSRDSFHRFAVPLPQEGGSKSPRPTIKRLPQYHLCRLQTPPSKLHNAPTARPREYQTSRTPCVLCASAQHTGGSIIPRGVCVFAHRKRKNPHPLWEIFKNPFPTERVLEAAFLWYLSFAEAKESTPKNQSI